MSSTSGSSVNQLEKLRKFPTFATVCPTSQLTPPENNLENVSFYQTIDLLCEGEIEGLCDKYGRLESLYLYRSDYLFTIHINRVVGRTFI